MDAADIVWLRERRHLLRIEVTEEGFASVATDDDDVYDALDDYLAEVLEGRLGDIWVREIRSSGDGESTHRIVFQDRSVTTAQLRDVMAAI